MTIILNSIVLFCDFKSLIVKSISFIALFVQFFDILLDSFSGLSCIFFLLFVFLGGKRCIFAGLDENSFELQVQ